MKSLHTMSRAAALLLAVALLGLSAGACTKRSERASARAAGMERSGASGTGAAAGGASLFEMQFPLTDQSGRTRHMSDFAGQPFVASMIYTNCKSVCPRTAADLKALDDALRATAGTSTRFLLFSLDPERDTPEALREFAKAHDLDTTRWTLLASSPDDMRTLAAVLDVRFRPDAEMEIAHTAVIAICDAKGVVRHRQVGAADDRAALVAAVRAVE